jgi:RimJ/RimL family protein N-acetyltransferase
LEPVLIGVSVRDDSRIMQTMIVPMTPKLVRGFHAALDSVAREGRWLAMLEAPSLDAARRFVRNGAKAGAIHHVALVDDLVIGWCDVNRPPFPTQRHSGTLGMGIVEGHRGHGVGTALLAATLDAADKIGLTRIELRVRTDNEVAIRLYLRFGFVTEGSCRQYLRVAGQYHDTLIMARLRELA